MLRFEKKTVLFLYLDSYADSGFFSWLRRTLFFEYSLALSGNFCLSDQYTDNKGNFSCTQNTYYPSGERSKFDKNPAYPWTEPSGTSGPLWEAIPDIYVSQACEVGGFYGNTDDKIAHLGQPTKFEICDQAGEFQFYEKSCKHGSEMVRGENAVVRDCTIFDEEVIDQYDYPHKKIKEPCIRQNARAFGAQRSSDGVDST